MFILQQTIRGHHQQPTRCQSPPALFRRHSLQLWAPMLLLGCAHRLWGKGDWRYKEPNLGSWDRGSMLAHVLLLLPTWWAIFRHKTIVLLAGPSMMAGPNFLLGARICNLMKVAGPGKLPVFSAGLSPEQFYFHQKCSLALPHVQAYMKPPRRLPPPAILFS